MSEAQQMWNAAIAIARSFTESPEMRAYYKEQGRKRSEALKREIAEAKAKREAVEAKKASDRAYDRWALNGGADECTQFGIRDGCKPECPVFERGECCIQDENAALFKL